MQNLNNAKVDLLEKELTETQAFLNKQNHIKQTKIDELQKLRSLDEMAINQLAQANQVWRTKCDKLQARIDEITNHVGINFDEERDDDQHSYWSGYNQAMRELNDILKVESK